MATSCTVFPMADALADQLRRYTEWEGANTTTTNKLIEQMIQAGRVSREDVENGDIEKVRDAILAATTRDTNINSIAQGELASMLKDIQYARRVRLSKARDWKNDDYYEARRKAIEKGTQKDFVYIASSEHKYKNEGVDEKASIVQDLFNGSYLALDKFTSLMTSRFVETATNRAAPRFIKKYKSDIEKLENYLNRGLNTKGEVASQEELTKLKEKISKTREKIKILQDEGWLGASRIPEVMNFCFVKIAWQMDDAYWIARFIRENREKYQNDTKKILDACTEYMGSDIKIQNTTGFIFAQADLKLKCIGKIAEFEIDDEDTGLTAEETKRHNDAAMDYRYFLFDEMCRKLTAISDASFSVRVVKRKKDREREKQTRKDNEDETEEKTNDMRNQEDENGNEEATADNELTEEEESEREIQFVSNKQRSVTSSLSSKVKAVLGSLWEYRWDEASKSFKFVKDDKLNFKKLVPKGFAFMFLLRRFNQEHNGKGLRNGDEVYDYLKKKERYIPWLHGIVEAMDNDPSLKTQFFVAFYKGHQKYRIAKPATNGFWGQVDESKQMEATYNDRLIKHAASENLEGIQMFQEIQDQVYSGVLLTTGKVAVGNKYTTGVTYGGGRKSWTYLFDFEDISVYDENGNINSGSIEIDYGTGTELTREGSDAQEKDRTKYHEGYTIWKDIQEKGQAYNVHHAKATGIYGLFWFVETRLAWPFFNFDAVRDGFTEKGVIDKENELYAHRDRWYRGNAYHPATYQQVLDERRPVLDDLLIALHAMGVNCTMDDLINACQGSGEKLEAIVRTVHDFVSILRKNSYGDYKGEPVFDVLRKKYQRLASVLSILNKNNIEDNTRWHDKNYHCYGQRSLITELTEELGDDENDEEWAKYVDDHYYLQKKYADENPESKHTSFFYDANAEENGDSFNVLNGILRDMDPDFEPGVENEPEYLKKYKFCRLAFRDCDTFLGVDVQGWNQTKSVEYEKLTVAQKVMLEVSNFFNPLYKDYRSLRNLEYVTSDLVKYALPIASDSNNHIFVGARAFFDLETGSRINQEVSSYEKDGLLDRAADVIFSEFNRINCYSSNSIDGKPIPRPDLPKNFKKKMLRFCAYPELNDMQVAFGNKEEGFGAPMSFYDAMKTFLSEGKDGQDFQLIIKLDNGGIKTIEHKAGGRSNARELALTAVDILFTEYFRKDMDFWDKEGVFEYDKLSNTFVNLTTMEFQAAAEQYARRSAFAKAILDDNSTQGRNLKDQLRREGVYDFLVSFTDVRMGEVLYGADDEAKRQYIDAVEGTENKEGYRNKLFRILAPLVDLKKTERFPLSDELVREDGGDNVTNDKYYNVLKQLGYIYDIGSSQWFYSDYRDQKKKNFDQLENMNHYDIDSIKQKSIEKERKFNILNNALVHLLHVYAMNKMSFKSQVTGLLVGDLAQFKDATDLTKRSKAFVAASERCDVTAVDTRHNNRKVIEYYGDRKIEEQEWIENQKTITIQDFEAKANKDGTIGGFYGISQFFNEQLLPMLQKDLAAGVISEQEYIDYCSGYQGMTVSDGQSFRTLESMYKLMKMLGLDSESLDNIYDTIMSGGRLSFYEIQDYFSQMKTVAYDEQEVPIEYSVTLPSGKVETRTYMQKFGDFIKDSQFTLMMYSQEMSEYLGRDSVLKGVLEFASENQVDVVHFGSTKKFGEFNTVSISECKNGAEAKAKLQAAYNEGLVNKAKDIRHKESWKRIGRQLVTKEHLVDKEQGVGTQLDKLILADIPESWWHYSANNPGAAEQSPTYIKLFNEANEKLAQYTPEEFRNLVNAIKILNMREDLKKLEENFDSKEKLSQMLISAIDGSSKYADNVRDALKINPETGDFNIPLDHPVIFDAIQTVISSAVRKHVIKQRTAGGTAIQFSSVGRTDALKTVYEVDPDSGQNRIKYVEALLPAWSKDLFKAFAKPDGTLDINDVPVELRTMIGYRIPTEHLYSAVPIRVVGFLDSSQGSSIMLPQEIVVWSGSDFDIDKIFLMRPEFEINKDGSINMGQGLNYDHPTMEELKNSTRLERNNLLVKLYNARLTSDFSCRDLARPGGFAAQKKMARIMNILANQKSRLQEGETPFTLAQLESRQLEDTYDADGNLIEGLDTLADRYGKKLSVMQGSFDDQIFKRTMTGTQMIGIYALHNAFHAVIQTAKITLSKAFVSMCGFKINGRDMRTTLGDVYDEEGNSILRNIGGFLSAAVDNAKDPILADLAQNPLTADLSLAFLHMGYSIKTMCLLMNQPIVQQFLRENKDSSSLTINTKVRSYCKANKITQMEADLDNATLAASITEGAQEGMENDKIQRSVMYALCSMTHVADSIKAIMNEVKITSPKDNMANTFGDTLGRMRPVSIAPMANTFNVKQNGKNVKFHVFEEEEFDSLVIPDFDMGENEPMDADVYMNGYESNDKIVKPRLPFVQMCYDAGFVRVQNLMKRLVPSLSTAMVAGIEKLKSMAYMSQSYFSSAIINAFVNEYKIYQAMNFAFKEDVEAGVPISQMRRAYLLSFPKYYRGVLALYGNKEGTERRDLRKEFSILSSLKVERSSRLGMEILWMSSSGVRVTNRQLNEHVTSWERMTKDKDPLIRNLAIQLYKYSVYYNGCTRELHGFGRFAPASIMKEYNEYNDFLRKSADIPIPDRFFDQFIRNHADELSTSIIHDVRINSTNVLVPVFFDVKQVDKKATAKDEDGEEQEVITKKASYSPKDAIPVSAVGEIVGNYIRVISPSNTKTLYRKQETIEGEMFVKCGTLGYKLFKEYDPNEELDWSVGFDQSAYLTEENMQEGLLDAYEDKQEAKRNKEEIKKEVARQKNIFKKLIADNENARLLEVENSLEDVLYEEGVWKNVKEDKDLNLFVRLQHITKELFHTTIRGKSNSGEFSYSDGMVYDPTSGEGQASFLDRFKLIGLKPIDNKKVAAGLLVRGDVTTNSSKSMNVAVELDYLTQNSDGSFNITMPVFVTDYYRFEKATVGNGIRGTTDLSNIRESDEAYLAVTYMYSLKRMLSNLYPGINIADMMLMPIIAANNVYITKKDGEETRHLENYEIGDEVRISIPRPVVERWYRMDNGVLHLPVDGDSIIVSKPQVTAKTTAATSSVPTGNPVTYREIFEKFLDEGALSKPQVQNLIDSFDGKYSEKYAEILKENYGDDWESKKAIIKENLYKSNMNPNRIGEIFFKKNLRRFNVKESVIEKLYEAIKNNHDVKGDDGVSLCKL